MKNGKQKGNFGTRYPKEIREQVVKAIVSGELLIDEAMEQYNVPIRMTAISWVKRYQQEKVK